MRNIYLTILLLLCAYCSFAVGPITGPSSMCIGSTATLSNSVPGGIWTSSSPNVTVGSTSGIVIGVSAGTASITYTAGSSSATILMTISSVSGWCDLLKIPPSICLGSSVFVFDSSVPWAGPSWGAAWDGVAGPIAMIDSNASGIAIEAVSIGSAIVSFTDYLGCTSTYPIAVTPATCTGTPVAGTATIDSLPCRGQVVLLRLSGHTDCGTVLQWQSSTDGVTWVDVVGAVTAKTRVKPIVVTHYRCKVTCISTGLVGYSNTVTKYFSDAILSHTVYSAATDCDAHFSVSAASCSGTYTLISQFGDGASDTTFQPWANFDFAHSYSLPGTYTIKHILYNDSVPLDSVIYAYEHLQCAYFPIETYHDRNNSCLRDLGDDYNLVPISLRVDSSGVTIDTITIITGIYYRPSGPPGTVYKFTFLPLSSGLISCAPFILDTVQISTLASSPVKYYPVQCSSSTGFDLFSSQPYVTARSAVQFGGIYYGNTLCFITPATVTLTHSNKYVFSFSYPPPSSIVGNVVTWNLTSVSGTYLSNWIYYRLNAVTPITFGDTVNTSVLITPTTGDTYPLNNSDTRCDTIRTAYDPNDITVSPAGNIPNNTTLQYTVRFENTGNDTAHNIYVLDTLPNNLDPRTLDIVSASAAMYISITNIGGHNIAKFDFPNIKLLDSSHHGLNTGMFVFKIKTRPGLADGTYIPNRVGIYFDDNEVVMTNTASNTILIPSVSIAATSGTTVCEGAPATFNAVAHSFTPVHYRWFVNGSIAGIDNATFTSTSLHQDDSVTCRVVNATGDSVLTVSNTVVMSVNPLPSMPALSGASSVCVGSSMIINAAGGGGTWSASNSNATVSGGNVTGITGGVVFISYTVSNSCGATTATHLVSVNVQPATPSIAGASSVCVGGSTLLSTGLSTGTWSAANGSATVVNGNVTGRSAGIAFISFTVANSCGTAMATHLVSVNPLPDAGLISGADSVYVNTTASLTATTPGGSWTVDNGNVTISPSGEIRGVSAGTATVSYQVSDACGTAIATHNVTVGTRHLLPSVIVVSPNPASKEITIENAKGGTLRILNLLGQEIYVSKISQNPQQINVASLANGIYMLHVIRDSGEKAIIRLVKE